MRCKECGNDLMLSIEPQGVRKLLKLLPLTTYRCLRCGNTSLRFSDGGLHMVALKLVLMAVVLSGMIFGVHRVVNGPDATSPGTVAESAPVQRRPVEPPPAESPRIEERDISAKATPTPEQAQPVPARENPQGQTASAPSSPDPEPVTQTSAQADIPAKPAPEPEAKPAPAQPAQKAQARPAVQAAPQPEPKAQAEADPAKVPRTLGSVQTLRENGTVMVSLLVDGPVKHFSSFSLEGPPRLVVDLPGRWTYKGQSSFTVGQGGVKDMRIGMHDDKLRLVFDLANKKPVKPVILTVPHGLLISLE